MFLKIIAVLAAWLATMAPAAAQSVVSFDSSDGSLTGGAPTPLRGLLFVPPGPGPFPAVVGMHGCGGLFNKKGQLVARETAWAETLTAHGYVVLFPDSFGPRRVSGACSDGGPGARPWAERSADAYGALLYLQSLPAVIGESVGLIGWSQGGGTVLFAVRDNNRLRPAVLTKGDFRAAVAFYPGWCNARNLRNAWTTRMPFLLEIGAADDWTPAAPCVEQLQSAIERGERARIKVYDGAFHDFDWPGMAPHAWEPRPHKLVHTGTDPDARADALTRVPDFLDEFLKPTAGK